jgi:hypothetical protein
MPRIIVFELNTNLAAHAQEIEIKLQEGKTEKKDLIHNRGMLFRSAAASDLDVVVKLLALRSLCLHFCT